MSNTNDSARFLLPDNLTQDFIIPYALATKAIAVGVGDACYLAGTTTNGDVAYPADQLATLGSEALDQIQFAKLFVGYSQQQILLAEINVFKRFTIRTSGPASAKCPSQTWKHGDLVGVYSNGVAIDPQQVDKVTNQAAAIGICIRDQPNPSARVTFNFESRIASGILANLSSTSLFDAQSMTPANVLTDANQTFTIATPFFSTMLNTSGRTITLPVETTSKSLAFFVGNLAASAGSITFKGSAGSNILTNAVLPAGKSGFVYCDGVNWYGFISA